MKRAPFIELVSCRGGLDTDGAQACPQREVGGRIGELPRATPRDLRSACLRIGRHHRGERAFADACLAADDRDPSAAAEGIIERSPQGLEFGVSTAEDRTHRPYI